MENICSGDDTTEDILINNKILIFCKVWNHWCNVKCELIIFKKRKYVCAVQCAFSYNIPLSWIHGLLYQFHMFPYSSWLLKMNITHENKLGLKGMYWKFYHWKIKKIKCIRWKKRNTLISFFLATLN